MWASIVAVLQAIRAMVDLIKFVRQWQLDQEKIAAEKRAQDLADALAKAKKAETDDEIWASQDNVVSNKPRP